MGPRTARVLRYAGIVLTVLLVTALVGTLWVRGKLTGSLPQLEGTRPVEGLLAPVTILRDARGVPTVRAANRLDLARATGFLHAQERFFQMDLQRRSAAGELAALVGSAALARDRRARVHRFRAQAERAAAATGGARGALIEAYSAGVNSGLAALEEVPFEYLALRTTPEPWRPEDTLLVVLAMYLDLQGGQGRLESTLGVMRDLLPAELFDFLVPRGTEWDAPVIGDALAVAAIPGPEVFDLREARGRPPAVEAAWLEAEPTEMPGSNNWVVAGSRTVDGTALLANDMHLQLSMPNIWYRASFVWPVDGERRRVTGVTLPGAPPIIAGSNGDVAWGFTNAYGDWSDLVVLEPDPADDRRYLTLDGPREFRRFEERIDVAGGDPVSLEVLWTVWGPVVDRDHRGRRRALRWTAHDPEAVDMGLVGMETASTLDEALDVAAQAGIPAQNCVVAERGGRIGWTLMGPIPRRVGHDGRWPVSWAAGTAGWDGYLAPGDHPRIVDPPGGTIWTANNLVDPALLEVIGDGGFSHGSRARQIRDGLQAVERADEDSMLAVQCDDRALLLSRWRELLLELLDAAAIEEHPRRGELRRVIEQGWTGRASVDSAAYRLVRAFRLYLAGQVFDAITASCGRADERFSFRRTFQWEGPLWELVTRRPPNLLDPRHDGWRAALLAATDRLLEDFDGRDGEPLDRQTWGRRNTVRVRHPLSLAVPQLGRWLDMQPRQLPGGSHMPRVQGVSFGASQRMVVAPGQEQRGIFHMPGGQSGHPLSPYYGVGHDDWADGRATPFLPGPDRYELILLP